MRDFLRLLGFTHILYEVAYEKESDHIASGRPWPTTGKEEEFLLNTNHLEYLQEQK